MQNTHNYKYEIAKIPPQLYINGIKRKAENRTDVWFLNQGFEYAKLCVAELIRNTYETLYIFDGPIIKSVFDTDEVLKSLKDAVYRGVSIRLIQEQQESTSVKESPSLQFLIESGLDGDDVKIKMADIFFIEELNRIMGHSHRFIIGDKSMTWIARDKYDFKAMVNYNDSRIMHTQRLHHFLKNWCEQPTAAT